MVFSAKKIELIERYYNEDLSPEESEFFMEQMLKDSDFAEEVKQFNFVFSGIDKARANELKNQFISYEQQHLVETKKSKSVNFSRFKISLVATFSIFIISSAYLFLCTSPSQDLLYADYFKPYPNVIAPVTRSLNQESGDVFLAMNKYDTKNYTAAISAFDELLIHTRLQNEILFYKAVALMAKGSHLEAKTQLELMNENGEFKNQRKWYLALVSLQLDELQEMQTLLNDIVSDQSSYSVYATQLLNEFFPN